MYPPAPAFLFQPPASYGPKVWNEANGPDRYRRALYTFRYRSVPYPMLQTFDAPNGDIVLRPPGAVEHAAAGADDAERAALPRSRARRWRCGRSREGGATDARAPDLRLPPLRRAHADRRRSRRRCCSLLAKQTAALRRRLDQRLGARRRPSRRPPTLPTGVTPAQLAAWTAVARVLLNLDETITKE